MFIVWAILAGITAILLVIGLVSVFRCGDWELLIMPGAIGTIVFGSLALSHFSWTMGEEYRTGYIYSAEQTLSSRTYHIRFSQQAGEDTQEPFCANVGSEIDKTLLGYVGSNTKIVVKIPAKGVIKDKIWDCGIEPESVSIDLGELE